MLVCNYDPSGLRAQLALDFDALSLQVHDALHVNEIVNLVMDSALSILRDLVSDWNAKRSRARVPAEILALILQALPFTDRIRASHVSRAWRAAALAFPAVWSDIEISPYLSIPVPVLTMALSRTGQHPVDFSYHSHLVGRRPQVGMVQAIEEHMSHMRSIVWHSRSEQPRLDLAAPMLECIKVTGDGGLRDNFLAGQRGRLTTLCLSYISLPHSNAALSTVTHLEGGMPVHNEHFTRLFEIFPQLQLLSLRRLHGGHLLACPRGPAPRSLRRVHLSTSDRHADPVQQYLEWKTEHMADIELSFLLQLPTDLRLDPLVAGVVTLSVDLSPVEYTASIIARDAQGRRHAVQCTDMAHDTSAGDLAGAILAVSLGTSLSGLHTLSIAAEVLDAFIHEAPPLPCLKQLAVHLYEIGNDFLAAASYWFPWSQLDCLAQVARYAPALEVLVLELRCWDEMRRATAADAGALLSLCAALFSSNVPQVRIRGFSQGIVRSLDPAHMGFNIKFDTD